MEKRQQHTTIPYELSKKLVLSSPPEIASFTKKRVSNDAATAVSEALRLFLVDAHRRSLIEAECDEDIHLQQEDEREKAKTPIGANHVTRIAGDLLMDFS
mmetsp:Transcript_23442/g.26285  ORF Transcript_23442/g.26285 Transcript_23442/m.26285 type:complete len:100 (-) Transcript_23442:1331-1630(-)